MRVKTDLECNPLDFHLTGGEVSDTTQFETSLDPGPDITPRVVMTDKGYDSRPSARQPGREDHTNHPEEGKLKGAGALLSEEALQAPGTDQADDGQTQTLQAHRPLMRKNRHLLLRSRQLRLRPDAYQIRPQGLQRRVLPIAPS
jgi:hypothetical protein